MLQVDRSKSITPATPNDTGKDVKNEVERMRAGLGTDEDFRGSGASVGSSALGLKNKRDTRIGIVCDFSDSLFRLPALLANYHAQINQINGWFFSLLARDFTCTP